MDDIERIQGYYRDIARRQYAQVTVEPFDCFFHPTNPLIYFNYAIPRGAVSGDVAAAVADLRAEFIKRGRRQRFEFIERFAPGLAPRLAAQGLCEESRLHLMTCTAQSYLAPPPVEGLTLLRLSRRSPVPEVSEYLLVRKNGFEGTAQERVDPADIDFFYASVETARPYLARLHGEAVGAGAYTLPIDGLIEVAGITTLAHVRRRGIASVVAGRLASDAFAEGAQLATLTAGSEAAGRMYERVGFVAAARMLAYSDPSVAVSPV